MLRRSNRNATGCKGRRGINRSAALWALCRHRHKAHWTGADKRLDRFKRHSDRKAYAFEELVAEIGNCLICATLGLTPDFDQSGAYIEGWMKAMKEDNRAIFRAASEAQKALDFVLGLTEASQTVAAE